MSDARAAARCSALALSLRLARLLLLRALGHALHAAELGQAFLLDGLEGGSCERACEGVSR